MIPELSDEENLHILVEQFGFHPDRARFVIDLERGRIDGDCIVEDGPLTEADKKRLGIGSVFDAPTGSGPEDGPNGGQTQPAPSRARELVTALFRAARELLGRAAA